MLKSVCVCVCGCRGSKEVSVCVSVCAVGGWGGLLPQDLVCVTEQEEKKRKKKGEKKKKSLTKNCLPNF